MAKEKPAPRRRLATTDEGRESQMIALAMDLAEKQMREGTASAQVISHYLKIGSIRGRLEEDRLREENALMRAKVMQIEQSESRAELYADALRAMRSYSGQDDVQGGEYDEQN